MVGVNDEPTGLMAKAEDTCLATGSCCSADNDANQDDEAPLEYGVS